MTLRRPLRVLVATWVAAVLVCSLSALSAQSATAGDRPNIVVVHVDDLGWQDIAVPLGPDVTTFNRRYGTPHLARLAREGVRFTNAYAGAPVCTPTRVSLLTGQWPARTRVTYWTLHRDRDTSRKHPTLRAPAWRMNGLDADTVTLADRLRDAGYRTIHVGKAHFGAHGTPASDPCNLGFDVNIAGHGSGGPASFYGRDHFRKRMKGDRRDGERKLRRTIWDVPGLDAYHGKDVYLTEALATEACRAVEAAVDDDQRFFLHFCPYAVHAPIMANRKYSAKYAKLDKREAAYATMIETVDAALGSIRATLERLGQWDRTVVIFASDNGGLSAHARGGRRHWHNAPLRSGKGSAYEGGIRTPLVIAGAGVTGRDRAVHLPVVTADLFPTILEMARVAAPDGIDGRSLQGLLGRSSPKEQAARFAGRPLLWHQPHRWGANGPGIEPFTAVRVDDWKLIYFHADRRFELYDLAEDLAEAWDRVASEPAVVRRLANVMQERLDACNAQLSLDASTGRPIPGPAAVCEDAIARTRALLERATACVPTPRQRAWQRTELAAFVHFGPNTFTDVEWGSGKEAPAAFNPTDFDADQWVRTFKAAGFRMVVLTAKHHDGFCLWPSAHTKHSVRASPWRDGEGDVVRAVADACKAHGLRFGFYLSPADLHEMQSGGRYGNRSTPRRRAFTLPGGSATYELDDYNAYFVAQLVELTTRYGPVHEVWFDGANPKPGTGQKYDYAAWYDLVRRTAPEAVIAIKGPDVRWVGNEAGHGRESEWSVIPIRGAQASTWPDRMGADLGSRRRLRGAARFHWYPAETDTSIRPGWFYHAAEDERVKSLSRLLDIYDASVGNNCGLLLNVPPDRRGRLHENDVGRLLAFGEVVRETFAHDVARGATGPPAVLDGDDETHWTTEAWAERGTLHVSLDEPAMIDTAVLAEHLPSGQRIEGHAIDVYRGDRWVEVARGTTVGYRKIHRFAPVRAKRVRVRILASRVRPTLSRISLYRASAKDPRRDGWR